MALENEVRLVGFCGAAPDYRIGKDGRAMAKLSLYTEHTKHFAGQLRSYKEVHVCLFFGKNAKRAHQLLMKGSQVYIVGSMHYHRHQDESGRAIKYAQVIVDEFKLTTKAMMTREVYDRIFKEDEDHA